MVQCYGFFGDQCTICVGVVQGACKGYARVMICPHDIYNLLRFGIHINMLYILEFLSCIKFNSYHTSFLYSVSPPLSVVFPYLRFPRENDGY